MAKANACATPFERRFSATAEELARKLCTIPYEVPSAIASRVARTVGRA